MTELDLDLRIRTFKASSSFTPGDICSFSINFGEGVTLPGKYDPESYMQDLEVDVIGKNVLVVCPGNAGLAVAAVRAGASTVVVLEPRPVYHRAIPQVATFAAEVIGTTFSQRLSDENLVEAFDIVFWSEGLDEISHPKSLIQKAIGAMSQGAALYIEVNHGHSGVLPESTNSWKPTAESFAATLPMLGDLEILGELAGRSQTRKIYVIKNNKVHVETQKEKVEHLETQIASVTEKTESMIASGHLPTKTPELSPVAKATADKIKAIIAVEEGEMDSIYEGASTPKSKEKENLTKAQAKKPKPKG